MNKELIRLLAAQQAGLQVPMSMGPVLGAATEPTRKIRDMAGIRGWATVEECESALLAALEGGAE